MWQKVSVTRQIVAKGAKILDPSQWRKSILDKSSATLVRIWKSDCLWMSDVLLHLVALVRLEMEAYLGKMDCTCQTRHFLSVPSSASVPGSESGSEFGSEPITSCSTNSGPGRLLFHGKFNWCILTHSDSVAIKNAEIETLLASLV